MDYLVAVVNVAIICFNGDFFGRHFTEIDFESDVKTFTDMKLVHIAFNNGFVNVNIVEMCGKTFFLTDDVFCTFAVVCDEILGSPFGGR